MDDYLEEARRDYLRDEAWQLPIAIRMLNPFYRLRGWEVRRYPFDHPMQCDGHVDVCLSRSTHMIENFVDEKIMRRRNDGGPPMNVSCETWSCSVEGHKRKGWMQPNALVRTTVILYCYADSQVSEEVSELECLWIPYRPLLEWFWDGGEERWKEWISKKLNRTICRLVPIEEILESVPGAKKLVVRTAVLA